MWFRGDRVEVIKGDDKGKQVKFDRLFVFLTIKFKIHRKIIGYNKIYRSRTQLGLCRRSKS